MTVHPRGIRAAGHASSCDPNVCGHGRYRPFSSRRKSSARVWLCPKHHPDGDGADARLAAMLEMNPQHRFDTRDTNRIPI